MRTLNNGFLGLFGNPLTDILLISLIVAALAAIVWIIFKLTRSRSENSENSSAAGNASTNISAEKSAYGDVKLINVDEKDAAAIMAIISDNSEIPLNELRFKSIKLIGDKQ